MSSLQQPSRSSPAPLGWSRRDGKDEQLVKRPTMIGESRVLSRSSFDPSPLPGAAIPRQPYRAMPTAEVVGRPDQPHARLKRPPLTSRRPGPSRQRGQPGAQGGLKPLDVGGVDHRAFASLRTDQTSIDRLFSATHYYTPKNPDHPSPSVALDRLGDHEAFWQKESWTTSLAGAKRLAKDLERLLRVTGQPIGAKQKGLESATGAHAFEQRANQSAVAPYPQYAAEPQPASNRKRRGQPHHPTDDPHQQLIGLDLRQEHPSSLHDVLVEASALMSAHQLPAIDGAFVQTESRNDGLRRAAVCQKRYDGRDEGVRACASGRAQCPWWPKRS